ncbi:hypothetical protein [Singapore grouper iridovirus]|uniref:Transmembrane protein n=1 Tax=Grouper iridovirus TaxID=127569 RepID=Q5GAD9_9VIRU|nr:unknown protein [Grouper iridovirus]WRW24696.1 hypothetical protein [Singapore grouper iridovirus]
MDEFLRTIQKPNIEQTQHLLSRYSKSIGIPIFAYGAAALVAYLFVIGPHKCPCGKMLSEVVRLGIFLGVLCAMYNWYRD